MTDHRRPTITSNTSAEISRMLCSVLFCAVAVLTPTEVVSTRSGSLVRAVDAMRAQGVPSRTLTRAQAEHSEAFTEIGAVWELKDGRVLALDSRDLTVQLIDFRTGRAQRVGRKGSGPGEYSLPIAFVSLGGDSVGIVDDANSRLLVVRDDGKTGGVIRLTRPRGGDNDSPNAWLAGSDARGQLYGTGIRFETRNGRLVRRDSIPILRFTLGQADKAETIAWARQQGTTVEGSARGKVEMIGINRNPFAAEDQWAVASDGSIAIAEAEPYRVHWIDPLGTRIVSQPISYTPQRFTEAHKEEWRAAQRNNMQVVSGDDGRVTVIPQRQRPRDPVWPAVLPPFLMRALWIAPDGSLWIRRTGPVGMRPTYDVIDRQGRRTHQVLLPQRTRVVGFGRNGAVYVVRVDDDDLEFLQRYRIGG